MFNRKMIGHSLSWAMALCIAGSALFQPVSLRAREDASEPETTEESQTEETQAEPSPEDVSQPPEMTQQEEIMKFNTEPITGGAFYRGVTIWVSAGPGTFEEGTALQVTAVPGTSDRVGFDVSFYDPTGAKVQPQNDSGVYVSFDIGGNSDLLSDGQERKITVYHVNDQGGWETMRSDITDRPSHHTEITAFQFSEYGVYSEPVQSVTEPKGVPVGSDLAAFLTNVEIMAPTDENGQYVIHPN
ncbi:MAG: hypothetical protein J6D18_03825, partial [Erysipelotrichaceae bacterium]|nr:hypothetical protein [Erysipelotrichaceae bacterium]